MPGTTTYGSYRSQIRDFYRQNYPLTKSAREIENLNPGNGAVSRICHEPKVSLKVLQDMLAPAVAAGQLQLLLNTSPVSAVVMRDKIQSVECLNSNTGQALHLQAKMFIDASEEGDLLPLAGAEYVIGAESQAQTGEPHASEIKNPANIQALTYCFAMDHLEGEDHTIEKPEMYPWWRTHYSGFRPTMVRTNAFFCLFFSQDPAT